MTGILRRYVRTVGGLAAAAAVLVLAWSLAAPVPWLPAVAVSVGWSVAVAGWLSWTTSLSRIAVHVCAWVGPAAVLLPLIAPGWLVADGLALWWPLSTLLAVALALPLGREYYGSEPQRLPVRRGVQAVGQSGVGECGADVVDRLGEVRPAVGVDDDHLART
jgi:hypothetical protein